MTEPPYRALQEPGKPRGPWYVAKRAHSDPDRIECGDSFYGQQRANLLAQRLNEAWLAGYRANSLDGADDKLKGAGR